MNIRFLRHMEKELDQVMNAKWDDLAIYCINFVNIYLLYISEHKIYVTVVVTTLMRKWPNYNSVLAKFSKWKGRKFYNQCVLSVFFLKIGLCPFNSPMDRFIYSISLAFQQNEPIWMLYSEWKTYWNAESCRKIFCMSKYILSLWGWIKILCLVFKELLLK